MSRTSNSSKNIVTIYISKILLIVLNFITRTVLIKTLGTEYLGINGLFTNILSMLSLAELGIGTAIIFKLYKPIEDHDEERIIALMNLYKKVYVIIGFLILAMGFALSPFLPYIIDDYEKFAALNINPFLILALYVFNSASSYWFFAYKQAIVTAHQKTYLMTVYSYAINVLSSVSQIISLLLWKNFIVFTVIMIFFNITLNFVYARIANKNYPYIRKKPTQKISKKEIGEIFKDCGALFLYKSSQAITSASDSIIVSSIMGISVVGIFSNYTMISLSIRQLVYAVYSSIEASIGSIYATGNLDWKQKTYKAVNLVTVLIYGVVSVGMFVMCDDFITLWLGKDYIINSFTINGVEHFYSLPLLFALEIYIIGMTAFLQSFRNTFGLFRQLKWRPLFTIIINLLIGIFSTPYIGVAGTVLGTIISYALTSLIVDPIVIIKTSLDLSIKKYFLRNTFYTFITVFAGGSAWYVCSLISGEGIIHFITKGVVCVAVTGVIYFLAFFRTKEFKILLTFIPEKLRNKFKIIDYLSK